MGLCLSDPVRPWALNVDDNQVLNRIEFEEVTRVTGAFSFGNARFCREDAREMVCVLGYRQDPPWAVTCARTVRHVARGSQAGDDVCVHHADHKTQTQTRLYPAGSSQDSGARELNR